MDFVYFIVLVSSLILVHEFGHFLFAKVFGVKVLTFSLGFGPKIIKLHGRETEYCVSLLPLGGYVRMLEESKNDLVMPEDRRRTFESISERMVRTASPVQAVGTRISTPPSKSATNSPDREANGLSILQAFVLMSRT